MNIKITLLPPQPTPKRVTVHRTPSNLGEHRMAFLNSNNPRGFMFEDIPEEPIAEHLAALFMIVLAYMDEDDKPAVVRKPKKIVTAPVKRVVQEKVPPTPSSVTVCAIPFHQIPLNDAEYQSRRRAFIAADPHLDLMLKEMRQRLDAAPRAPQQHRQELADFSALMMKSIESMHCSNDSKSQPSGFQRLTPLQEFGLYKANKNAPAFNVANPNEILYYVDKNYILTKEGRFPITQKE